MRIPVAIAFVATVLFPAVGSAKGPLFETQIAPIFKKHCVSCHNSKASKAELDLSSPAAIFKGGESGEIITRGKHDESLLYEMVHNGSMPPKGAKTKLTKKEVELIKLWIDSGTPFKGKINPKELIAAAEINNHIIEPLMKLRCTACHGLREKKGGLDLRTKAAMLKGGKSGPAIVLGKPGESLMLKRIHKREMPPQELLIIAGVKPITPGEVKKVARWIELGAPEVHVEPDVATKELDPLVNDKDRQFWSFQPPEQVKPPKVEQQHLVLNPIDAFILRKLEARKLTLSKPATRFELLRRACHDLHGLPPTPEQVRRFLNDKHPLAYERLIDRLLASPRYGERWGRYWLDLAGYADSEGKRSADPIRPYAYKFRDYTVRSWNADKPYDRFLLEQLAGDELFDIKSAKKITQPMVDNVIATGFLRMAPDGTGSDVVNFTPERLEVISDQLEIFGSAIMGLTIKCARCHSHKYDPFPQRDYYRLMAVFKGAFDEHDWLKPSFVPGQTKVKKPGRVLSYLTDEQRKRQKESKAEIQQEINVLNQKLKELAETVRANYLKKQLARIRKKDRGPLQAALKVAAKKRSKQQRKLVAKYRKRVLLNDKQVKRQAGYRRRALNLNRQITQLKRAKSNKPQIRALWDRGEPSPTYIYRRGDYTQPTRLVGPGVPSMLTNGRTPFAAKAPWKGANKTGRRLALAKWLVNPDHPLTARVMINRVWRFHFGAGIVRSLDNFGKLGTRPTHPELLDWLAREFIRRKWSIKEMHRLMMTSATFRQSSGTSEAIRKIDPYNKLLSHMPLRRMDAEELRDTLLQISGELNLSQYGRPEAVDVKADGLVTSRQSRSGGYRRSIYIRMRRKEIPTILAAFDLPQMNPNCSERPSSTVAQQSLHLMNDKLVRSLSGKFAERVQEKTADPGGQVELIFVTAYGRKPTAAEKTVTVDALLKLTDAWERHYKSKKQPTKKAHLKALKTICHTAMNSASLLYVD